MSDLILYTSEDGQTRMQLRADGKTVWLTPLEIAELFQTTKHNISIHTKNIFKEGELAPEATGRKTQKEQALNSLIDLRHELGLNIVDDWIAEQSGPNDIVITSDIPLAARCIAKQARVLDPKGRVFTEHDIGETLAMCDLLDGLRQDGVVAGGPAPMNAKDRSKFLSKLDELINAVRRAHPTKSQAHSECRLFDEPWPFARRHTGAPAIV